MDIEEALKWIGERGSRITGKGARLGDLVNIDLEEEFINENIHRCKYIHIFEC
ncbi:MAG: hypothetical protein QW534_08610 [Candidatus Methanomethylicia archaeon]